MGQCAKALPLFERALGIREAELGPTHPSTATTLNNLALLHHEMGQCAKALPVPLYERVLGIREAELHWADPPLNSLHPPQPCCAAQGDGAAPV